MIVVLYILLWCFICPLWHITHLLDEGSYIEGQVSNLEVHLKIEIEDRAHALIKQWAEA